MQPDRVSAPPAGGYGRAWVVILDGHAHLGLADGCGDVAWIMLDAATTGLVQRALDIQGVLDALDLPTPVGVAFPCGEADCPHVDRLTATYGRLQDWAHRSSLRPRDVSRVGFRQN